MSKESDLIKEIDDIHQAEEMFWMQRSRVSWLQLGDRNTHFFHASTVQRRC